MDRFLATLRAGKRPSVARFLQQWPKSAGTLKPVLEGMLALEDEYRRFRRRYPRVNLEELFDIPGEK